MLKKISHLFYKKPQNLSNSSILRVLIIAPHWVGDAVMAQTLLKYLRARYSCVIDIVSPSGLEGLFSGMPQVRQTFTLTAAHGELGLKKRWKLGRMLRQSYDWSIVLPNSWKSALLPWIAGIPRRTGWRGEWRYGLINDFRVLDKDKHPLMIQRFLQLGAEKNDPVISALEANAYWPSLNRSIDSPKKLLQKFNLSQNKPVLALCPGAEYGPAKRWPTDYFAQVAQTKIQEGWQIWVLGSPKDHSIAEEIGKNFNQDLYNFCGKTSLTQAIDLLSISDLVISNDTGLMHIAAALNKPLVSIYGSSSPHFTPPLSNQVKCVSLNLICSPCFERTCPLGHYHCLTQLLPEKILEASQSLLSTL